jgi:hypothetical protein
MSASHPPAPYLGKGNSYNKQPFMPWVKRHDRPRDAPCEYMAERLRRDTGIMVCDVVAMAVAEVRPGVFCWLCAPCADALERSGQ